MDKLNKLPLCAIILIFFMALTPQFADAKKGGTTKLTEGEESGIKLLALEKKGLIEISDSGPTILIYVEPKFWQAAKHSDKKNLCIHALRFFRELDAQRKHKTPHIAVAFYDITSKQKLAIVELETARIDILK